MIRPTGRAAVVKAMTLARAILSKPLHRRRAGGGRKRLEKARCSGGRRLREQVLRGQLERRRSEYDGVFENSPRMKAIKEMIDQVADTDATVLVWGESGVGKELVARAIHDCSPRRERTFVKVNCAALPLELLESELFGYERGAFTGAHKRKLGKFELADGAPSPRRDGEMPLRCRPSSACPAGSRVRRLGSGHDIKSTPRHASNNRTLSGRRPRGFREDLLPPQRRQYPRPPLASPEEILSSRALLPEVHASVKPAARAPLT